MGLVSGKKALIFGLANDHSIAWGISKALHSEGAELGFSYFGEALERRVRPLAVSVGSDFIVPCDATDDEQIAQTMQTVRERWGTFDILVHSIGFANRDE